jgi:hypothetical protein
METIQHAAIRTSENIIVFDKTHADCFKKLYKLNALLTDDDIQGFFTSYHRFVDREEAAMVAYKSFQIDFYEEKLPLTSEDLWSLQYNGKFDYDPVKGYILKKEFEDKRDPFSIHLDMTSRKVQFWPEWKKCLWGGK